ncbi:malonyl CoA-ACP transacylase [Gammaproteobacteria bacterium SCGC AG-212-F23]|nr:malonyl CoA-ACP transacylase [Gammaproteobacteria bacterium SCGC AG-212-F23]
MLGFVFPGQGSQSLGMLSDIAHSFPSVEKTFAEASTVLNYDLWKLIQQGPTEELDKTIHTQPALLTASYALWRIVQSHMKIKPVLLAGHSLGEYTALVCAEAMSFTDAVKVVAARGQYMQEASPAGQGALAAIVGLDDATVAELCQKAILKNEVLAPANYNSPGQVVIAGHTEAVERAMILAKESGARLAKILPVSVPSHCFLMKPAAERLQKMLNNIAFSQPNIPVINNVDVAIYQNAEMIRDGLVKQLFMPVRWVDTVKKFVTTGISSIVECGPGKVLNGLNKRIAPEMQLININELTSLQTFIGGQECLIKVK